PYAFGRDEPDEALEQVAAVGAVVVLAVALVGWRERLRDDLQAALELAPDVRLGEDGPLADEVRGPEPCERPHRVRGEPEARGDPRVVAALLEPERLEPDPGEGDGGRHAADAAASDDHPHSAELCTAPTRNCVAAIFLITSGEGPATVIGDDR